jgi:protein-S-isoprenylcysteine O-methyltransferase Ste14
MADLLFMAVGSLAVSVLILTNNKLGVIAAWLVTGAVSYATLYTFAYALMTGTGWLGVVMMFPAMIWSGNFSIGITPEFRTAMFRTSADGKTGWLYAKTLAQIFVVWSLILFVFPSLIVQVEAKLGIQQFTFPFQTLLSGLLFIPLSLIGLSSAYTMGKIGRGTPLPMDNAAKLVVSGIYSYIRNPMAVSGISQGLLVGVLLGSPLVLLYALMGGAIWQTIYRPLEEDDLVARFGAEYERYRQNVRCWIPRLSPWKQD